MKKLIYSIIILISTLSGYSQWNDSFTDNDLSNNPLWQGETTKFIIHNGVLSLNDIENTGSANLYTRFYPLVADSFGIDIGMDFNPSSANFISLRLYSVLNPDSYYEFILGGMEDDLKCFRVENNVKHLIVDGENGFLNHPLNDLKLSAYDSLGNWKIKIFHRNDSAFQSYIIGMQEFIFNKLEINCIYTSTRSNKFHFDNIFVLGEIWKDDLIPKPDSVLIVSENEVKLIFSEPVQNFSVSENFRLEPLGMTGIEVKQYVPSALNVVFGGPIPFDQVLFVHIPPLYDTAGNFFEGVSPQFLRFQELPSSYRDVVFSEFMPDPEPNLAYDFEFVELYNRSGRAIDISGWKFSDLHSESLLDKGFLLPESFIVLMPAEYCERLPSSEKICLADFPSLNNTGDVLGLHDSAGVLIDSLQYKDGWHDAAKREGGWSLENTDLDYRCEGSETWKSSLSVLGGTPGDENTHMPGKIETPEIKSVWYKEPLELIFEFDKVLLESSILYLELSDFAESNIGSYTIHGNVIQFDLLEELTFGIRYQYKISGIETCTGSSFLSFDGELIRAEDPLRNEIIINEILYEPPGESLQFIELYNNSRKHFKLDSLQFCVRKQEGEYECAFIWERGVIFPGEYLVWSNSPEFLKEFYSGAAGRSFPGLPHLPNHEGTMLLKNRDGSLLDSGFYTEDSHHQLLTFTKGVSLEKINPNSDGSLAGNWLSGAEDVGYASPGRRNSRFQTLHDSGEFACLPNVIQLHSGALSESLEVIFDLKGTGWTGSLTIYDIYGHKTGVLMENVSLSNKGSIFWHGEVLPGSKLREGIYTVRLKAFDLTGKIIEKLDVFALVEN